MSPTPAVVQLSSLAEVSEMAAVASRALKDDASRRAMLGGNFELSDELYASMIRAAYLAGKAYAVKQDGKFISIALWFEMSNALFSTAEQRALGFDKLFQKLSPETQYWWTDTYPETINKWQAQIFTEEERARLTWCFLLVTEPTHHDNAEGLAAALVNPWYNAVSEKGQLVGLATADESAANWYKAIGFRERGRTVIEGPTGKLPCISLSRE